MGSRREGESTHSTTGSNRRCIIRDTRGKTIIACSEHTCRHTHLNIGTPPWPFVHDKKQKHARNHTWGGNLPPVLALHRRSRRRREPHPYLRPCSGGDSSRMILSLSRGLPSSLAHTCAVPLCSSGSALSATCHTRGLQRHRLAGGAVAAHWARGGGGSCPARRGPGFVCRELRDAR